MSPEATQVLPAAAPGLAEIRYSLKTMLEELKVERAASSLAKEKFSQTEIDKLFKARAPRHAKRQA
jgi:hypothetical protein